MLFNFKKIVSLTVHEIINFLYSEKSVLFFFLHLSIVWFPEDPIIHVKQIS
jgi:hypothetical protein